MQIILGVIVLCGIIYYFLAAASAKRQRTRVIDLLVVGLLLLLSGYLKKRIPALAQLDSLEIGGLLIFAYGWAILIVEKFREGLHDDHR